MPKFLNKNKDQNYIIRQNYFLIIDLLKKLQSITPPTMEFYTNKDLLNELKIFIECYIPFISNKNLSTKQKEKFIQIWQKILNNSLPKLQQSIVLKDYHVDNMLILPREGINSIGLIDFQDALIGHPIYDLVSILDDARIDVPTKLAIECIEYYASITANFSKKDIYQSYNILGAQRNSRILGVFAQKAKQDHQSKYLQYIPRVVNYLKHNLLDPSLAELKLWYIQNNIFLL